MRKECMLPSGLGLSSKLNGITGMPFVYFISETKCMIIINLLQC